MRRRLPSGLLFGLPVVMDTRNDAIKPGAKVLLTYKGQDVATLDVESRWTPNKVGQTADAGLERGGCHRRKGAGVAGCAGGDPRTVPARS